MTAREKYPALMAYIDSRNAIPKWYDTLCADSASATAGNLADVAADLARAQVDYAASVAPGCSTYPYNSAMGDYLGLPINPGNHEPEHGYYMATRVMHLTTFGVAQREALRLIAEGRPLRIVAARAKVTRKPLRFHVFTGPEQIKVDGESATISNGKVRGRLGSSWSTETCMVALALALRTGAAYGESAT
jgi:hypothetical protein